MHAIKRHPPEVKFYTNTLEFNGAYWVTIDRLTEHNSRILGCVMMVDVQVALSLERHVNSRMSGEQFQHVIKKAYSSGYARPTRTVEVKLHKDFGLGGRPLDPSRPRHVSSSLRSA